MENSTIYMVIDKFSKIPFVDIFLPYTESFIYELEEINTSNELVNKFHLILLQELSLAAEVTLQEELDFFKSNGQSSYEQFVVKTKLILVVKYPVLDAILKRITNNYLKHIKNIFSCFFKDFPIIAKTFSINTKKNNIIVTDIDTSLGDAHSGESTALITLSDGKKLIYKSRNIDSTNSYNLFIDWVNHKLETNLKTIKCVSSGNYGWLEFVTYEPVNSLDELQEYYYKAGILLAITFLLGSKDCHYENIIASGKNPVIIDHETIIQPVLSNQSITTWDEQHKIPPFSVLESMLIVNRDTGTPLEYAGYGNKGNNEVMDLEKKVIHPNTIDSKRDTRFIFRKLIKENIPLFNDNHVFANNYKNYFIKGFSTSYDIFMTSREELTSCNSPISLFENQKIRYVWRPTFVYFRILKYMRGASFMSSFETYNSKLYELMSKAYQKDKSKNFKFILEYEMKQMLNGDIPFFNLNSLDCHLDEDKSFKIFQYNCIDNIRHRIDSLSIHHKNEQIEYITKWLQINTST
jgi:type 2 lantibiotic biosynthesis protein LanM